MTDTGRLTGSGGRKKAFCLFRGQWPNHACQGEGLREFQVKEKPEKSKQCRLIYGILLPGSSVGENLPESPEWWGEMAGPAGQARKPKATQMPHYYEGYVEKKAPWEKVSVVNCLGKNDLQKMIWLEGGR